MTEREYVEKIRQHAEAYIAQISGEADVAAVGRWAAVKRSLSPHTLVSLCDAWVKMQEAGE